MTDDIERDPALEPPEQDDSLPDDVRTDTPRAKEDESPLGNGTPVQEEPDLPSGDQRIYDLGGEG